MEEAFICVVCSDAFEEAYIAGKVHVDGKIKWQKINKELYGLQQVEGLF